MLLENDSIFRIITIWTTFHVHGKATAIAVIYFLCPVILLKRLFVDLYHNSVKEVHKETSFFKKKNYAEFD